MILLLVFLIGGHWAILQSAAWAGMLVSYSEKSTLSEALTKTFDGKNPCRLCKLVGEGKKSERKQEMLKGNAPFDISYDVRNPELFPPQPSRHFLVTSCAEDARTNPPPLPPPIAA